MYSTHFVIVSLLLFKANYSRSEESKPTIKYELSVTTPSYTYDKSIHTQETVTSKNNAFSITILSDVPILTKGMLEIAPDTYYFWMDGRNLTQIQPGALDNQNITEEIRLEGNKLTVIKTGTFRNLKIKKLDLSYNQISHLEEKAISDLPNLWEIHLGRNKIVEFHGNSFMNTPKMWTFEMTYNNLTKLEAKSFSFMKKDEPVIVGVGYNDIDEIDPEAFDEISVWNLDLSHNQLKNIPEEIFTKNPIKLLELEDNQLETLPEAFFKQENLTNVGLKKNPLRCDVQRKLEELSKKIGALILFDSYNC